MDEIINQLKEADKQITKLVYISALLAWDQETYMPHQAIDERSEYISLIEGLCHEKIVSSIWAESFDKLNVNDDNPCGGENLKIEDRAFLRNSYNRYKRNARLPNEFVRQLAKQTSLSQQEWQKARELSDFSRFKPFLKDVVSLLRQKAQYIAPGKPGYDVLLDEYEPGMTGERLDRLFGALQVSLKQMLDKIKTSSVKINNNLLYGRYDITRQNEFCHFILNRMGYDFTRGSLDNSTHPFTATLGFHDVRITNRYNEHFIGDAVTGAMHEGGHALYEQGFDPKISGLLIAAGTSLGIHESQSRLWENIIGRGSSFWKAFFPSLVEFFPDQLERGSMLDFYRALNAVKSSLIRVDADEVSYNLHIILRYNLEKKLLDGALSVDDLPAAWREESIRLLGVEPSNDREGVLQDMHWPAGVIGYFPTYTLGNLYSAQFFHQIIKDMPGLESEIEKGNLASLLHWLREKIHFHGSVYQAEELCEKVTGECLNPLYFIKYLERKYNTLYNL